LVRKTKIDPSWAFADKTRKDTAYVTHGYHCYPAKFILQIVSRLAAKYTKEGDLVVDLFGGCGTTLVESKVMCRPSIGAQHIVNREVIFDKRAISDRALIIFGVKSICFFFETA